MNTQTGGISFRCNHHLLSVKLSIEVDAMPVKEEISKFTAWRLAEYGWIQLISQNDFCKICDSIVSMYMPLHFYILSNVYEFLKEKNEGKTICNARSFSPIHYSSSL